MRSKTLLFLALVAGLTLAASGVASGGAAPPLTVNPQSGLPGSNFTVSGFECVFVGGAGVDEVTAAGPVLGPEVEVTVAFPTPLTESTNANAETGEWSVTFTVPEGTPPGTYAVSATCFNEMPDREAVSAADFDYPAGAVFTVGAETPVAPVVPPTPGAAPAPAVAGTPRLTG
jgi:hypothetical protein